MKISVLIPAYNCAATIRATLDSVFQQTVQPDEILVLNDGSTDETASILETFKPRITVIWQENGGISSARNLLIKQAQGNLAAFIDSDDLWHPKYLEVQRAHFEKYSNASGLFTGHVNFEGDDTYEWKKNPFETLANLEIIPPLSFIKRYNSEPGPFSCISHCCIPLWVLRSFSEPFKLRVAEDLYFFNLVAGLGPVVFFPVPLAAYRIRKGSLSSDRLKLTECEVHVFELLVDHYKKVSDVKFVRAFNEAFALKRRLYAKVLIGANKFSEAREQLRKSLNGSPFSSIKSLIWLFLTYMPSHIHPKWPSSQRQSGQSWKWWRWKANR